MYEQDVCAVLTVIGKIPEQMCVFFDRADKLIV